MRPTESVLSTIVFGWLEPVCLVRAPKRVLAQKSRGFLLKLAELALLKLMHTRISPNSMSMEHYTKIFSAVLLIERANLKDLRKLTGLDSKSVEHLLKNLAKENIVRTQNQEFFINNDAERLLELIEKNEKNRFFLKIEKNIIPKTRPQLTMEIKS